MRSRHRLILLAAGATLLGWASGPGTVGLPAAHTQQPGGSVVRPGSVVIMRITPPR